MTQYLNDSLTSVLLGVPVGMIIGYALAQIEPHSRSNRRRH